MKKDSTKSFFLCILFFLSLLSVASAQQMDIKVTKHYLNIPIGVKARMKMIELRVNGKMKREFPAQLAEDSISYWIYIDVSEFKNQRINISSHATQSSVERIYQDDQISGADSLYKETNRPQSKRGALYPFLPANRGIHQ